MNKIKTALVLVILVAAGITCINPNYPKQVFLQHIGTLLLLIPLVYDALKNRMPMSAFVAMTLFTLLHVVGANWIYSYVPYREWSISLGVPADYWGVPVDFQGDVTTFLRNIARCSEIITTVLYIFHLVFFCSHPLCINAGDGWKANR